MQRNEFLKLIATGGGLVAASPLYSINEFKKTINQNSKVLDNYNGLKADIVIAGGGLGGCAAALSALRNNLNVILTEETDWIGGQLTQQGVPPDEHQWIESHGATQLYRDFREGIRQYYRQNYPLTQAAKENILLNPGDGSVSKLCHEPKVALAVLLQMFTPYLSAKKLTILLEHKVTNAEKNGNRVIALQATNTKTNNQITLTAPYFVDATELGDILPLTKTEFVTGTESKKETGELHAPEISDPENNQAFTMCFAMDYIQGGNHTIEKPKEYDFWKNFQPEMNPPWSGKMLDLHYSSPGTLQPKELGFNPEVLSTPGKLNLWKYRRIINQKNFTKGFYSSDITIVNWPQNDYVSGNLINADPKEFIKHIERSKQQSLSLLYWLQTEVSRPDGGKGWAGLRLRKDIMGTEDGMAKYPYIRESRRIKALFTIKEEHVGSANRALITGEKVGTTAAKFYDTVGIGSYHIDLHPSNNGNNYIDFGSLPFQIPLGALIPQETENLIPANKNIGTTHITNGCYRLHPVEWNIGETVGMLIAYALHKRVSPHEIHNKRELLTDFQNLIRSQGIETHWPRSN